MRRRDFLAGSIGFFSLAKGLLRGEELFKGRDLFVPMIPSLDSLVERLSSDNELLSNDFSPEEIRSYFGRKEFKFEPKVIERFLDNPEKQGKEGKLSYERYRKIHRLDDLIKQGPAFFNDNKDALLGAEAKYGVDARYIAAILGIESAYGKNNGVYLAFNALSSLYIEPNDKDKLQNYRLSLRLKSWSYEQLKSLLIFAKKSGIDPLEIKGSYAAAVSPAQFIPYSLRHYYIGKNGDFKADTGDINDAIYSIAYYLKERGGWKDEGEKSIPEPGSNNWRALLRYNNSEMYARILVELATTAEWKSLIKPKSQMLSSREMEWC